jgi:hypothetical protein
VTFSAVGEAQSWEVPEGVTQGTRYRPEVELELSVMDGAHVVETAREALPIWTYPDFR